MLLNFQLNQVPESSVLIKERKTKFNSLKKKEVWGMVFANSPNQYPALNLSQYKLQRRKVISTLLDSAEIIKIRLSYHLNKHRLWQGI